MPAEKYCWPRAARPGLADHRWLGHSDGPVHDVLEAKQFNDVPVLIGYNSDEGASFSHDHTPQEYID